jgi:hypothetical protein
MSLMKGKTEGGSGGKRGHSNMDHWVYSHEIKQSTRKRRRLDSKKEIRRTLAEAANKKKTGQERRPVGQR